MATPASPQLQELMSHSAWLRRLARSLVRDTAAADDLVQETWLAALKNPPDPTRPARPWLAGVMRRLVAMRARGEARRTRRQHTAARREGLPSTAELVEGVDTQRRIAQAVLQLAEPYRTTVLLRYYEQMSSADIARRQGIPGATVRWRLRRGLEQMREELDQLWPDRRSWCLALIALERRGAGLGSPGAAGGGAVPTLTGSAGWTLAGAQLLPLLSWSGIALAALVAAWFGFVRPLARDGSAGTGADSVVRAAEPPSVPVRSGAAGPAGTERVAIHGGSGGGRSGADSATAGAGRERAEGTPRDGEVRVLMPDGSAARSLRAVALGADGGIVEARTDELGRLDLGSLVRPVTVFMKRPDAFLDRALLADEPAEAEVIRLAGGSELSGRLQHRSGAPAADLALRLTRDQPLFEDGDAPAPVRERLRSARIAHCKTDAQGAFRFVGLAPEWRGTLCLPRGFQFVDPGGAPDESRARALPIGAPTADLVFTIEHALAGATAGSGEQASASTEPGARDVQLIVTVAAPDGQRRAGARVRVAAPGLATTLHALRGRDLTLAEGREAVSGARPFACDREGVLELAGFVGDEPLDLELVDPLGNVLGSRRVQLDPERATRAELRLPEGLPVFAGTVRDDRDRPIVGAALVVTSATGASWRLRTDREGLFEVTHGEAGPVRLEVSKAGFETLALDGVHIGGVHIGGAQRHAFALRPTN